MVRPKVPVFLLKTKSTPTDAYEELFSSCADGDSGGAGFEPLFVPVLEHRLQDEGMARVRALLEAGAIGNVPNAQYGGLVFTSQRAVEAFTKLIQDGRGLPRPAHPPISHSCIPLTTVQTRAGMETGRTSATCPSTRSAPRPPAA